MSEFILNLAEYEAPKVVESRQKEYVTFGDNNSYYRFLIERYKNSTTNNAVINAITHLIYGRGLSALDASKKPNEYAQLMAMLSKTDVRRVVSDGYMLGQFALQVHYNDKHDKIIKAMHIPVQLLAPEKCDKDGEINNYFYSDNWENLREFPAKPIPAFGKSREKIEILFVKPYSVGMKYFAYPMYQGGLPYATLEEEIAEYLINDVQNGFSGTKVVNIIGDYTEDQQRLRSRQIQEKLTGSKGQKVIVSFSGDKELKTEVTDIPLNEAPEHYNYLSTECTEKILLSHKVVSGLIFGVAKSSGFSSNADELKNATILFDNMVIRPIQELFIEAFDQLLAFNNISLKLYFKTLQPLEFVDLENTQTAEQVAEKTGTELSEQPTKDSEIAQKLIDLGEDMPSNWVLIDSYEVDYENDDLEDLEIEALNSKKPKFLSKLYNLVSTGVANPRAKSEQDATVDGIKFMVRYTYEGALKDNSREFCRKMVGASKLYRKEDIIRMGALPVNKGWGPKGADFYSIWNYKGGGDCGHKWMRKTFVAFDEKSGIDPLSPKAKTISTNKAEKVGYRVRNNNLVAMRPKDMPFNGFLPTNKRFQ